MKTIIVDFSKRTEKSHIYLTAKQSVGLKLKERVRLTDEDIAVRGNVAKRNGKVFVIIDWDSTEFYLKGNNGK